MKRLAQLRAARSTIGVVLMCVALVVSGCSGGDGTEESSAGSASGGGDVTPSAPAALSKEFCAALDSAAAPTDLGGLAPAGYEDATAALAEFAALLDAAGGDELPAAELERVAALLGADGIDSGLAGLAEGAAAPDSCASDETAGLLTSFSVVARFAQADRVDEYCVVLDGAFGNEGMGEEPEYAQLIAAAPSEHVEQLKRLDALVQQDDLEAAEAAQAVGAFFGLGLYAEARCGVDGGFINAALASSMFVAPSGETSTSGPADSGGAGPSGDSD